MAKAFEVVYQGKKKPLMDWAKGVDFRARAGLGANERINFRDMINTISGICLSHHFEDIALLSHRLLDAQKISREIILLSIINAERIASVIEP